MYSIRMDTAQVTKQAAEKAASAIINRDMSKSEVARKTGIPYSTLSRKLMGRGDFTVSEIFLIATALDVEPGDLLPDLFQSRFAA